MLQTIDKDVTMTGITQKNRVLIGKAGLIAPPGRRMGHAPGRLSAAQAGTVQGKLKAMTEAGVHVCEDVTTLGAFCAVAFADILAG